ncbi:phosphatase PAP2 family protein [Roseixanthobacter glucoisosaccharinicivorans]|uniref:phosphatase PAP2 family protein n=1 Tax=Roseixanthobacter glucoisosaccharinicivorans TaxID=3119923 RepID=UPI00372A5EBB
MTAVAPRESGADGRLARVLADVLAVFASLLGAWRYLWHRPVRGPRPRVGLAGAVEGVSLTILVVSLIAALMILVDPLIPGLRLKTPMGVVHFFERITALGLGGVILWPLGLALLCVLALKPHLDDMGQRIAAAVVARIGFVFLNVAGVGLAVLVVKYLLGRARPYMALHLTGPNAQLTFDWFAMRASFSSFPSGHSTVVFAVALAFAALFPRARGALIAVAALVGISRVVLGSHYPSDVLAGAALACLSTILLVKLFAARRLVFAVAGDGTIRPMAGPGARRLARLIPKSARMSALEEARS